MLALFRFLKETISVSTAILNMLPPKHQLTTFYDSIISPFSDSSCTLMFFPCAHRLVSPPQRNSISIGPYLLLPHIQSFQLQNHLSMLSIWKDNAASPKSPLLLLFHFLMKWSPLSYPADLSLRCLCGEAVLQTEKEKEIVTGKSSELSKGSQFHSWMQNNYLN